MFYIADIKKKTPGNNIPQTSSELSMLRNLIDLFLADKRIYPPLLEEDVLSLAFQFISTYPEYLGYEKLLAVMINNYAWQPVVEGIPYNRRILLLPQCMRHAESCPAKMDELGLLCEQCGLCSLTQIITQAENLGYHAIVSEGTTAVKSLLSSGQIECVIGLGCLESFERSFPLTVQEAVPSIAIPLFNSDCRNSRVDLEWLTHILPLKSNQDRKTSANQKIIKQKMESWFTQENMNSVFGENEQSIEIAKKWLLSGGKRWRPIIMTSVYETLANEIPISDLYLMKLAVSIECFHKASLVHDDIADNDPERYGIPTLHEIYDIPVALNTGDLLTGFGYQLIAECGLDASIVGKLLTIAAHGHRDLCLGQGKELLWRHDKRILSVDEILEIFAGKTSPAFEVAFKFGAILADANQEILDVLHRYSKVIGIAYQIKDDLDDFTTESSAHQFNAFSPSLITAILAKKHNTKTRYHLDKIRKQVEGATNEFYEWAIEMNAIEEAQSLLEEYKHKALEILDGLCEVNLKIFLYRLTHKIIG